MENNIYATAICLQILHENQKKHDFGMTLSIQKPLYTFIICLTVVNRKTFKK